MEAICETYSHKEYTQLRAIQGALDSGKRQSLPHNTYVLN